MLTTTQTVKIGDVGQSKCIIKSEVCGFYEMCPLLSTRWETHDEFQASKPQKQFVIFLFVPHSYRGNSELKDFIFRSDLKIEETRKPTMEFSGEIDHS